MQLNELTGEVTLDIGGTVFRLRATVGRMSALETTLGVRNIPAIIDLLNEGNIRAVRESFHAMCASANAKDFDEIPVGRALPPAIAAIVAAIAAFLPARTAEGDTGKNGDAAAA